MLQEILSLLLCLMQICARTVLLPPRTEYHSCPSFDYLLRFVLDPFWLGQVPLYCCFPYKRNTNLTVQHLWKDVTDKFRWSGSNSTNCIINYYFADEIGVFNCFYCIFLHKNLCFLINLALNLGDQSWPVESKSRCPRGQIRWPRANGPVLTATPCELQILHAD